MRILNYEEVAGRAGIVRRTLEREIEQGRGPRVVEISTRRRGVLESDLRMVAQPPPADIGAAGRRNGAGGVREKTPARPPEDGRPVRGAAWNVADGAGRRQGGGETRVVDQRRGRPHPEAARCDGPQSDRDRKRADRGQRAARPRQIRPVDREGVPMVDRTAQNFISAAERFGANAKPISHLQPTTVYRLAAPSTPRCDSRRDPRGNRARGHGIGSGDLQPHRR